MIIWLETLFDAGPARIAGDFRMRDPGVLVDFAAQVLAVDEVQPAAIETRKAQTQTGEMLLLRVRQVLDQVGFDAARSCAEAFAEPISGSGPGDDEVHLVEVNDHGVVDVDEQLVRQEVAQRGIAAQRRETPAPSTRLACSRETRPSSTMCRTSSR